MYSCTSKEPLQLNYKQLLPYLLFTQVRRVWGGGVGGGHLWL